MVRHGRTDSKGFCIGVTDIPLQEDAYTVFKRQRIYFSKGDHEVYTSPLQRTLITAEYIFEKNKIHICDDLKEINMGEWENLSFSEIKNKWTDLYEKRGRNPYQTKIRKGESLEDVAYRMEAALDSILSKSQKDVVLVTHSGCIKALLCKWGYLTEEELLTRHIPNYSMTVFEENNGQIELKTIGFCPYQILTEKEIERIYNDFKLPSEIICHMNAVTKYAIALGSRLQEKGYEVDLKLLEMACRLHDIARCEKNHPIAGAVYLKKNGFYELASIIEKHHDLDEEQVQDINETTILFYTDKRFIGDTLVSIEERFERSRKKCLTDEAIYHFKLRYGAVAKAEQTIKSALEEESI